MVCLVRVGVLDAEGLDFEPDNPALPADRILRNTVITTKFPLAQFDAS